MTWQDWVFSVGQFVLLGALIPSIVSKDKPAIGTSIVYGAVAGTFSFAYLSLGLISSAIAAVFIFSGWMVLVVQKFLIDKKK